ncbi:MAG: S8 family serine peptidase, partial [Candidatus Promineifilaceae bacterium]|nr:S8 family serine peptidase [Candidatus Promineifilaceae bacterium]
MKSKIFKLLLTVTAVFLMIAVANAAEDPGGSLKLEEAKAVAHRGSGQVVEPKGSAGPEIYIVVLDEVPLASYRGGIKDLEATNPAAKGERKLDANSAASNAYLNYLDGQRAAAIGAANQALGRQLDVAYEYGAALVGYAAEMTPAEATVVAGLPNVRFVQRDQEFELHTDVGPTWIGAPGIWDGSATGGTAFKGEGIIVGVIDTGVDPWNPSFADVGDDGYDHTNPFGAGNYVGVCDPANTTPPAGVKPYDPTFPCNDKLIGAWGYDSIDGSPRDANGHGSHTASTAAGNVVNNSVVIAPTATYTATMISGVAPHANVIMYAACCTGSALTAARDQVVLDGVDVVNYSIGASAPTTDPWADAFALQWLAVRDAGIFVATSAGNAGPGDETV